MKDLQDAVEIGRVEAYRTDLSGTNALCTVVYGWTGGTKGSDDAARIDELFIRVRSDMQLQPTGVKLITGGFNADTADLPALPYMITEDK